jgi:predicted  nucleic acid-binding Zn-ribbon protein
MLMCGSIARFAADMPALTRPTGLDEFGGLSRPRSARQTTRIRQLERKLAELLGQQAWQESGLGAPHDIEQLQRRITELEQSVVDLTCQLSHRDDELAAARAANREMIAQINRTPDRQ